MEQYIPKSALVAKIKERIKTYNKGYANGDDSRADALEVLLHDIDIDTIETKEVDSERVFNDEYSKFSNDTDAMDYAFPIDLADFKDFAKHFFELGMKMAQKGEEI